MSESKRVVMFEGKRKVLQKALTFQIIADERPVG